MGFWRVRSNRSVMPSRTTLTGSDSVEVPVDEVEGPAVVRVTLLCPSEGGAVDAPTAGCVRRQIAEMKVKHLVVQNEAHHVLGNERIVEPAA